jgi:hypothetical protein
MVPALLMFAAACVGFGGRPWLASLGGALFLIAYSIPDRLQTLWRYRDEPVMDLVLGSLFVVALSIGGALGSAWAGYGIRLLLKFLMRAQ